MSRAYRRSGAPATRALFRIRRQDTPARRKYLLAHSAARDPKAATGVEERRCFFAVQATSLAIGDDIGERIAGRRARDAEEPAVRLVQIGNYADCEDDGKCAQGDDRRSVERL